MTTAPAIPSLDECMLVMDFETTGLDAEEHDVLECFAALVDQGLDVVAEFGPVVVRPDSRSWDRMDEFVRSMHEGSGLMADLELAVLTVQDLDAMLDEWLAGLGFRVPSRKGDGLLLAGSSCRLDMEFLERRMPVSARRFTYRMHDVSGMRQGLSRYAPQAVPAAFYEERRGHVPEHRAEGDVRETLREMRAWRDSLQALAGAAAPF